MTELDFVIDQDDEWQPPELPQGAVRMGGKLYPVQCPKDSLPVYLARIQRRALESEDPEDQERVIRDLLASTFPDADDVEEIMEKVVDPSDHRFSLAFLTDTVQKVQKKYEPYMTEQYAELGLENPMAQVRQPQDHLSPAANRRPLPSERKSTSRKPAAKKAAKKAAR